MRNTGRVRLRRVDGLWHMYTSLLDLQAGALLSPDLSHGLLLDIAAATETLAGADLFTGATSLTASFVVEIDEAHGWLTGKRQNRVAVFLTRTLPGEPEGGSGAVAGDLASAVDTAQPPAALADEHGSGPTVP